MSRGQFRVSTAASDSTKSTENTTERDQGARVWEHLTYGRMVRHYIKPDEYVTPALASSLADKFLEVGPELPGTMRELGTSIRVFLGALGSQMRDPAGDDTFDLSDLRRRHLDGWEQSLLADQRENETDTRYRYAIHLFALLRRINNDAPGLLHEEVTARLERTTRLNHVRRDGDPEFPSGEAERLRTAARRIVNEALAAHRGPHPPAAPSADVITALHVLLSLGTGEPPEVLRRLHVEDVVATPVPGRDDGLEHLDTGTKLAALVRQRGVQSFCVRYVKTRASERYEQVYTRRDDRVFKPLTALIALTAQARAVSGLPNLWLVADGDEIKEPFWGERPFTLRAWVKRVGLTDFGEAGDDGGLSEPVKFSRLRKSVTTEEALAHPAHYLRSNRRHTAQTFFQHYTNSGVLRAEAGRVLMQAVSELFDTAVHGPTIVTPAAEELLAAGREAPTVDRDTAERLLSGTLDTGVAACRNPLDSPHVPDGDLCPFSTTGDCYSCSNALITQHHLPAVIRLHDLLDPSRAADIPFWRERWKLVHDFITQAILPAFPPAVVAAARERAPVVLLDAGLLNDLGGADAPA